MNPINKLVLGTVQFGLNYGVNNTSGQVSLAEIRKIFSIIEKNNIKKLDTSYAYGESEKILGSATNCAMFEIISKYPCSLSSPSTIFKESVNRLNVNKLYGYLIHHFDFYKENPSIWDEFTALKEQKKINKIGFSLYSTDELEYLLSQNIDFDLIQFPYSIFDQSFAPYFGELAAKKIEVHVRSIFLQGLFFKKSSELPKRLTPLKPYIEDINNFCAHKNITIEELALNSVVHNKFINGVLIGVDSAAQLSRNINSIWPKLPLDIYSYINSINVKEKELLNPTNWNK